MGKATELNETQAATKSYLRAWRTLGEIAENFEVTNLAARNRVAALREAGVKLEERVREVKRGPGQVGRAPNEYRIAETSSKPAKEASTKAPKRVKKAPAEAAPAST